MSKTTYTVQFQLNSFGEAQKDDIPADVITRLCEHNLILAMAGQQIMVNSYDENTFKISVGISSSEIDGVRIDKQTLTEALSKCALIYGEPESVSGWQHYPAELAYSDDPEGDYFDLKEVKSKALAFKESPIDTVEDVELKFYIKTLQCFMNNKGDFIEPLNRLMTMAALGTNSEILKLKAFFSNSTVENVAVNQNEIQSILHGNASSKILSDFLENTRELPKLVNHEWIDSNFQHAFVAALEQHVDEMSNSTTAVLAWMVNDLEFVRANKEALQDGFANLSFSHVVDLYKPEASTRSQVIIQAAEELEALDDKFCSSLNPFG